MSKVLSKTVLALFTVTTLALTTAGQATASKPTEQSSQQQTRPASQPAQSGQSSQGQGQETSASASATTTSSTSASANAGPASAALASNTNVHAQLMGTVDASKCHPGQEITAKTTEDVKKNGHVALRKGTRLVGHVTEAQARTKENAESSIGIAFDEAVMKDGTHVPFHAGIQALAESQASAENAMYGGGGGMMGGGGMASGGMGGSARGGLVGGAGAAAGAVGATAGGVGSMAGGIDRDASGTLGATSSTAASVAGNVGGLDAAGHLTSTSSGVFGLEGLKLESSIQNATQASVITSAGRNVHLSNGTQMLLKVTAK